MNYQIDFRVISKPMISNLLNYPNPFTTSIAFVFTVTGTVVPQNIRIQILTITGKIIREITKDELGPLHIGRNITEFKWDGSDMYGQKVANGVYLYRVLTNLNGKSLDKFTDNRIIQINISPKVTAKCILCVNNDEEKKNKSKRLAQNRHEEIDCIYKFIQHSFELCILN